MGGLNGKAGLLALAMRNGNGLSPCCREAPQCAYRYARLYVFGTHTHTQLRAAAACTMADLWHAIATALKGFSLDECQNYLAAAGYDATARKML